MIKIEQDQHIELPHTVCGNCNIVNVFEANFCSHCGSNLGYSLNRAKESEGCHADSLPSTILEKFMIAEPAHSLRPLFKPRLNKLPDTFSCCFLNEENKSTRGIVSVHNHLIKFKFWRQFFPKKIIIPAPSIRQINYKYWYGASLIIISSNSTFFTFSFYPDDAIDFYKILSNP